MPTPPRKLAEELTAGLTLAALSGPILACYVVEATMFDIVPVQHWLVPGLIFSLVFNGLGGIAVVAGAIRTHVRLLALWTAPVTVATLAIYGWLMVGMGI